LLEGVAAPPRMTVTSRHPAGQFMDAFNLWRFALDLTCNKIKDNAYVRKKIKIIHMLTHKKRNQNNAYAMCWKLPKGYELIHL